MIYKVFFILCFILASCKKEKDDEPYYITITGVVTDQVTRQPVEGATVTLGRQSASAQTEGLVAPTDSTLTGPDGMYSLQTGSMPYSYGSVSPGTYFMNRIAFIARKAGYVGSNRLEISYYGSQNSELDFVLYHSSELNLHIKDDTTNSINAVNIKLIKYLNNNYYTVLTLICDTKNLDSTYVINNLFGNVKYDIEVLTPGGENFSPPIRYSITPLPDAENNFEISF